MKPNLRLLPTEVWVDILCFPWIGSRSELGRLVDRIGNRKFAEFLQFYLHEWGKHTLGDLGFDKEGLHIYGYHHMRLPIAQTAMPENIKSIGKILINHFDSRTLAFLRRIQPLLANVNLSIQVFQPEHQANLRPILAHLSPLLDRGLHSVWAFDDLLPHANQLFTGNLRLDQCKVLSFNDFSGWGMDQGEARAARLETNINFCLDWLTSGERDCTEPRLYLIFMNPELFEQISAAIRQNFLSAKRPCTFALQLERRDRYYLYGYGNGTPFSQVADLADFHLENNIGEHLDGRLERRSEEYTTIFQISRHQANANAGPQLQEWVEKTEQKRYTARIVFDQLITIGQIDATNNEGNDGGEGKAEDKPSTSKQT